MPGLFQVIFLRELPLIDQPETKMIKSNKQEPAILCKNLSKDYSVNNSEDYVAALSDFSFSVNTGEFVCVVGPSGCGKSTLLRLLAGLLQPTSGEIQFGHPTGKRPRTAMVFQSQGLFPWMTVLENAALGLKMQGVDKNTREQQTREFLEKIGLKKFIHTYPHTLSGGMRQRVAISRAFLAEPEILLMDEPFGMLDAQTRMIMQEELLYIWQERRHTVIYITHDIEEALFLGDRVFVMSGRPGKLLEDINVDFSRPRDRLTIIENSTATRLHIWRMLHDEVLHDFKTP